MRGQLMGMATMLRSGMENWPLAKIESSYLVDVLEGIERVVRNMPYYDMATKEASLPSYQESTNDYSK